VMIAGRGADRRRAEGMMGIMGMVRRVC